MADKSSTLTPTQRHIALTLSLHMNERGGSCFPSIATLCEETGLSNRAVIDALRGIEEKGYLSIARDNDGKGGRSKVNKYTATVPETVNDAHSSSRESVNDVHSSVAETVNEAHGSVAGNCEPGSLEDVKPRAKSKNKNQTSSHAASLPAPEWGELASLADLVAHFASISPPSLAARLRTQLNDPDFWRQVHALTEGTQVYYDTAFRRYVTWLLSKPTSRQHKNLRRGFMAWVSEEIRRDLQRRKSRRSA